MKHLESEIHLLSLPYSSIRRRQKKWKHRQNPEDSDSTNITVNDDLYTQQGLEQRLAIKRNPELLKAIFKYWQIVNPFRLPGLSEQVYQSLLKFTYKLLFKQYLGESTLDVSVSNDIALDLRTNNCLYFCDFYDAVFDIIDQASQSKSLSEYISLVFTLSHEIKHSAVLNLLNLHTKWHCFDKKAKYHYWMKDTLKITHNSQEPKKKMQRRIQSLPRLKGSKRSNLEKVSPLSTHKKSGFVKSFLLEEIIEGRKKYLNAHNREKIKSYLAELWKN